MFRKYSYITRKIKMAKLFEIIFIIPNCYFILTLGAKHNDHKEECVYSIVNSGAS